MKTILFVISLLVSTQVWAFGKKLPADLSSFRGSYESPTCNVDTIPYPTIPHTIDFNGHSDGSGQIVLRTNSKILTTRSFAIQDRKNQKCYDNGSDYTAKCKASTKDGVLKLHINWDCHMFWFFCAADTPEDYTFQVNAAGNLEYTQEDFKCTYKRVSIYPRQIDLSF